MVRRTLIAFIFIAVVAFMLVTYVTLLRTDYRVTSSFVSLSIVVLFAFLILLVIRLVALIYLSHRHHVDSNNCRNVLKEFPNRIHQLPLVSIIVPAFNEGVVIESAITSLAKLVYPRKEIIVVDDGSTDNTYKLAAKYEKKDPHTAIRVLTQQNSGKATALNHGIRQASGELVLCVDADSRLEKDSLAYAVTHFEDPRVGAVAGNVKVINRDNFVTKMQALEYIEGLNMVRRSQGYFHAVNIIPGPLGLFRKSVLLDVGMYDDDTFAEDCDLTVKLLARGWKIQYEPFAIAWTEAPETVRAFFRQRYRWTRGILQALRKHQHFLFHESSALTRFVLWYMAFEAILWPAMNIFAQAFFLYIVIFFSLAKFVIFWWGQLTVLDIVTAMYCLSMENESMKLSLYSVPYRIYFVLLTDVCKVLASVEELLQVRMSWGKLERVGKI